MADLEIRPFHFDFLSLIAIAGTNQEIPLINSAVMMFCEFWVDFFDHERQDTKSPQKRSGSEPSCHHAGGTEESGLQDCELMSFKQSSDDKLRQKRGGGARELAAPNLDWRLAVDPAGCERS